MSYLHHCYYAPRIARSVVGLLRFCVCASVSGGKLDYDVVVGGCEEVGRC